MADVIAIVADGIATCIRADVITLYMTGGIYRIYRVITSALIQVAIPSATMAITSAIKQ